MTARDFAYWLQGFFELTKDDGKGLTPEQTELVKRHLNLVFAHDIDPSMGPKEHQVELNNIHNKHFPTTEEEALAKWGLVQRKVTYLVICMVGIPPYMQPRC